MIKPSNITKKEAKHILRLIHKATCADIMARIGASNEDFIDYALTERQVQEELLIYIYGSASIVILGHKFGLLSNKKESTKKRKRK